MLSIWATETVGRGEREGDSDVYYNETFSSLI